MRKMFFAKEPDLGGFEDFINHLDGGGDTGGEGSAGGGDNDPGADDPDERDDDDDGDPRADHPFDGEGEGDAGDAGGEGELGEGESVEEDPNLAIIAKLEEQVRNLTQIVQNTTTPKAEPKKEPEPEQDLFKDETFTSLANALELDEAESQLMAAFMKKFGASVAKQAVNDAMERTPAIVNTHVSEAQKARDMKKNFYRSNPALEPVQNYVAQMANTVARENPALTVDQVLEEAAKRSYETLGIDKDKVGKGREKPGRGKKPAFANTPKGGRKPAKKQTALEKELSDMLRI